jgi:hypothetical protein
MLKKLIWLLIRLDAFLTRRGPRANSHCAERRNGTLDKPREGRHFGRHKVKQISLDAAAEDLDTPERVFTKVNFDDGRRRELVEPVVVIDEPWRLMTR